MRTTMSLDDHLIKELMEVTGAKTMQVNPDSQKFFATASELSILCNGERAYMIEEEYARICRAPGCKLAG